MNNRTMTVMSLTKNENNIPASDDIKRNTNNFENEYKSLTPKDFGLKMANITALNRSKSSYYGFDPQSAPKNNLKITEQQYN